MNIRTLATLPLCFVLVFPILASGQTLDKEIAAQVDKIAAQAIQIRQQIHKNPELSNREVKTAELVANHLRALGLQVKTGIAKTGVVGILQGKSPGPVIAVRADMDALPVTEAGDLPFKSTVRSTYAGRDVGVSHACGHDVHVAAGLGTASVLAALNDRGMIRGTVMFIFQPAEEGPPAGEDGGAGLMVREGIFKEIKPQAIIALHTNGDPPDEERDDERLGRMTYTPGPAFAAATKWTAVVRGRQSHGAAPHLGVDPVVTSAQIVLALQTIRSRVLPPLSGNVVTVGIFRGGDRNNIIPGEVALEGTIRTFDKETLDIVEQRMREIFDGITKSAHATFELAFDHLAPLTSNDRALTERLVPTLERIAGKSEVLVAPPETGAEDFSFFSDIIPGFYFELGVVPAGKTSGGHHTPTFYADDKAVPIGIKALSTLVVDYLAAGNAK
ncbi:MAG TPA: amidohydrolase [Vicinamibacterales bacterium]